MISAASVWEMIHALEDGWFAYRGNYIGLTEKGRDPRRRLTFPTAGIDATSTAPQPKEQQRWQRSA